MKKILIALMLSIVSIMCFGQKEFSSEAFVTETVDEFGDKTGNMKVGIMATGYFSNSATSNSCAELIISVMKNKSWYSLYEYCGNHSSDDSFNIKFTGTTTHTSVNTDYSIPYKFFELCKNNDTIYVKMNATDRYATTTAVFKLFECKKFYKLYIETFGEPELITFKRTENTLYIYEVPILKGESTIGLPQIRCVKSHMQYGRQIDNSIALEGRFSNNSFIDLEGKNITIDNIPAKADRFAKFDFNWFLKNIHIGSVIRIECTKDSEVYEEFKITEEQYNAIINFYSE